METRIVEVTREPYWCKLMVMRFTHEFGHPSAIEQGCSVVRMCGWSDEHLWVCDLETGEGACFCPGGFVRADMLKHPIRVGPLFVPFLEWFWKQPEMHADLAKLPELVELTHEELVHLPSEKPLVHILKHGHSLCGVPTLTAHWPEGHKWVGFNDPEVATDATCPTCINAQAESR